eukprot:1157107_1
MIRRPPRSTLVPTRRSSDRTDTHSVVSIWELPLGGELFDVLMFIGRLNEEVSRTYLHQLVNGLEAMHTAGLSHQSLKPDNLLFDCNYMLKITYFPIIQPQKPKQLKTHGGCKGWIDPHLINSTKYAHKKDIFDLGILLFSMYAGFPPFQEAVATDWWWDKLNKGLKYLAAAQRQKRERDKANTYLLEMQKLIYFGGHMNEPDCFHQR